VGGWLADTIGWRWSVREPRLHKGEADPIPDRSFLGQAPIFFAALCICWMVLPPLKVDTDAENTDPALQLKNIDFIGVFTLGLGIFSLMLPLEIGGSKVPVSHTYKAHPMHVLYLEDASLPHGP
jgi:hypothetical protein